MNREKEMKKGTGTWLEESDPIQLIGDGRLADEESL